MKSVITWLGAALCACLLNGEWALAADARVPASSVDISKSLVVQKEALVKLLLADSPAVKRVEGSDNVEAKKNFTAARDAYQKALAALKVNDLRNADKQLNDATWMIGKARQLVPDPIRNNIEHRVRYAQMVASVESLKATYQRHLQRGRIAPAGDAHMINAGQLIDSAKREANAEYLEQANRTLGAAERLLMTHIGRVLGTRTIEYAQRFESLSDEYAFELDRNRSYTELIPIALAEFKPDSEAIRQVNYFVETNRQMREQAQQLAAARKFRDALAAIRGGTGYLQSALRAAGLQVPSETKIESAGRQ